MSNGTIQRVNGKNSKERKEQANFRLRPGTYSKLKGAANRLGRHKDAVCQTLLDQFLSLQPHEQDKTLLMKERA